MRLTDIKAYLVTRRLIPENQESPIHFISVATTPEHYFYRRNHFPYPVISEKSFLLSVSGEVPRPMTFHHHDLLRMPSKEMTVVLECSGNNRGHFRPRVFGEQWEGGAIQKIPGNPYSWMFWTYTWVVDQKGEYTIMSKATDSFGFVQPAEAKWNRKGYGYNAYSTVYVKVD